MVRMWCIMAVAIIARLRGLCASMVTEIDRVNFEKSHNELAFFILKHLKITYAMIKAMSTPFGMVTTYSYIRHYVIAP